jgi:hypothetical protein
MDFPLEIWVQISHDISKNDIFALACTNKQMYKFLTSDIVWKYKLKSSWYLSDYNPFTLTAKRELLKNESLFEFFKRRKRDDQLVNNLIDKIRNFGKSIHDEKINKQTETSIKSDLDKIYSNFNLYVPCLLSKTLHITTKMFRSTNDCILEVDFKALQRRRNNNLAEIYIASSILENGKYYKAALFFKDILESFAPKDYGLDLLDVEKSLLYLSLFDSRYHELILIRHQVIKSTCKCYELEKQDFDETTTEFYKIKRLVKILYHTIHKLKRLIMRYQTYSTQTNLEDLSILRFYCGDSNGTPLIRLAVIEKLIKMVGINVNVIINNNCMRVKEENQTYYLFCNERQIYIKQEHEIPFVLRFFPSQFTNINGIYIDLCRNFFRESKSRVDSFKGADQIIYQLEENEKIVTVHRNYYIQGQVICCGGFVNKNAWNLCTLIFSPGQLLEKFEQYDIYNLIFLQKLENVHIKDKFDFKKLYTKELINSQVLQGNDIYWECENLQIGDLVWSDASQARGIIVEISESNTGYLKPHAKTYRGDLKRLTGSPFYRIFFGASGFATFSREYLKRDKTDRVEGLLVYDIIGRWFSHYDYDSHRFIYRHGYLFI